MSVAPATLQSRYNQMRKAVEQARLQAQKDRNFQYASGWSEELIGGFAFGLSQIQQSKNDGRAVQTLHYVDGKKVNRQEFFARLEVALEVRAALVAKMVEERQAAVDAPDLGGKS